MNVTHDSDQEGCSRSLDGYALREKFCKWLEGDLDARTKEVLGCYRHDGPGNKTFLYDDILAILQAKKIEQSIFSEGIDKCYVEALKDYQDYREQDIGTFLAAEHAVTRCALQRLCEKYRNPEMADDVCYYLYPESFTFGAKFWTRDVPRYEMKYNTKQRHWFAGKTFSTDAESAWALLFVNLGKDGGAHYDLIKLAGDT